MAGRRPVVLLVIDGLRRDRALRFLTTPARLADEGQGWYLPMTSLMPTNSRPSYNTISTGLPSPQNGIVDNHDVRLVTTPNIWSLARAAGLCTAASAYYWWSELYNRAPFDKERDTRVQNGDGGIQHAFFYRRDGEPDAVVLAHALLLWQRHHPDVLLVHPMSVDYAGDYWGADALAYDECVRALDTLLGPFVTALWRERPDAVILLTADHGMSERGGHGWDAPELREVVFYTLGRDLPPAPLSGEATALDIAPTVLRLLHLPIPAEMAGRPLVEASAYEREAGHW